MKKFYLLLLAAFWLQQSTAQTDTIPPTLVCKNLFQTPLGNLCYVQIWATDLIETLTDDQTPAQEIEIGIRKRCTGVGFPEGKTTLLFFSEELGLQTIEVWARDNAGNMTQQIAHILVLDFIGICGAGYPSAQSITPLNDPIAFVEYQSDVRNCEGHIKLDTSFTHDYWGNGNYSAYVPNLPLTPGFNSMITPVKDTNYLNGVTTYDLHLISMHILGIQPFDSPYQIIAADANQDGKVTTYDIIILRRLILGIIDELPNGKSWRFLPGNYVFPNPQNPFVPPFPEQITISPSEDPVSTHFKFIGVKIGDVNFTADPGQ